MKKTTPADSSMKISWMPGFTQRGFRLLSLGLFIPLSGILFSVPPSQVAASLVLFLGALFLIFSKQALLLRQSLKSFQVTSSTDLLLKEETHFSCLRIITGKSVNIKFIVSAAKLINPLYSRLAPTINKSAHWTKVISALTLDCHTSQQIVTFSFLPTNRDTLMLTGFAGQSCLEHGWIYLHWNYRLPRPLAIEIFPNIHALQPRAVPPFSSHNFDQSLSLATSSGREFSHLRRYVSGDDLKLVDWKRSAHGRDLLIRTFQQEAHQRILVALDCGQSMSILSDIRTRFEHALDAVAHLAFLTRKTEDELGLIAFAQSVLLHIPCRNSLSHKKSLIASLRHLEPQSEEADFNLVANLLSKNHKRMLIIVLTSSDSALKLKRIERNLKCLTSHHLLLVASIPDESLDLLAKKPPSSKEQAYIVAAARIRAKELKDAQGILTSQGFIFRSTPPESLPQIIANEYARLKAVNRL